MAWCLTGWLLQFRKLTGYGAVTLTLTLTLTLRVVGRGDVVVGGRWVGVGLPLPTLPYYLLPLPTLPSR